MNVVNAYSNDIIDQYRPFCVNVTVAYTSAVLPPLTLCVDAAPPQKVEKMKLSDLNSYLLSPHKDLFPYAANRHE